VTLYCTAFLDDVQQIFYRQERRAKTEAHISSAPFRRPSAFFALESLRVHDLGRLGSSLQLNGIRSNESGCSLAVPPAPSATPPPYPTPKSTPTASPIPLHPRHITLLSLHTVKVVRHPSLPRCLLHLQSSSVARPLVNVESPLNRGAVRVGGRGGDGEVSEHGRDEEDVLQIASGILGSCGNEFAGGVKTERDGPRWLVPLRHPAKEWHQTMQSSGERAKLPGVMSWSEPHHKANLANESNQCRNPSSTIDSFGIGGGMSD
jgi:hypothetical protein